MSDMTVIYLMVMSDMTARYLMVMSDSRHSKPRPPRCHARVAFRLPRSSPRIPDKVVYFFLLVARRGISVVRSETVSRNVNKRSEEPVMFVVTISRIWKRDTSKPGRG
jgi:hypothetical protein